MGKRREFACFDSVEATVACVERSTVLLQNLADGGDGADILRRLQGVAAAAHRGWQELNGRLTRTFFSSVEREDISAFVRELSELCHALWRVAVAWGRTPPQDAARWAAHLAAGSHLLRQVCEELPRLWQEHELAQRAESVYDWRREADRLWAESEDPAYEAALSLARVADTAQWLALKNT